MIPSANAISLIKKFESCKLEAYQDIGEVWTIGWGSTGPGIVEGLTITQSTADGMLLGHVKEVGADVCDACYNLLSQNQLDAIACLVYNIGINAFKNSTLLKLVRNLDFTDAAKEFPKWNHVKGIIVPGLTTRRMAEQALFLKGTDEV